MTEDLEFPRLTPSGERMPPGHSLLRRPEELTDEQFDLLAAAWAEDALSGDALNELESVIASAPGKRERANSFHSLRLAPGNENWPGMRGSLRNSPAKTALRRTIIPAILAAAAMLVLILYGPAGARLKTLNNPARTTGTTTMTVAEIPGALPVIRNDGPATTSHQALTAVASRKNSINSNQVINGDQVIPGDNAMSANQLLAASQVIYSDQVTSRDRTESTIDRTTPPVPLHGYAVIPAVGSATEMSLATITPAGVSRSVILREEKNWMLRSISFLASAVTGREKQIDGYMIANGCINGINTILGWEMELDQVSNKSGDPVAVSFSSSLLSFTKPLNKSTP